MEIEQKQNIEEKNEVPWTFGSISDKLHAEDIK